MTFGYLRLTIPLTILPLMIVPLLALTGCTAGHAGTGGGAAVSSASLDPDSRGVILSARGVILQIAGGENGVLGALGAPASEGFAMAPATEFIVRQDNGRVISVIEPVPNRFHPGQHVRIERGIHTRLRPLA
jgi:outer membrane lipoprotein SlyB